MPRLRAICLAFYAKCPQMRAKPRGTCVAMDPLGFGQKGTPTMKSNTTQKIEGAAKQVAGKVQNKVGKLVGNRKMEAEGKAKELAGKARKDAAKTAERAKGELEELKGNIKGAAGKAVGNERLQAEGKADELEGKARKAINR